MSKQVCELESVLEQLVAEHRKLLSYLETHQAAMKQLKLKAMDDSAALQEASRSRIILLENRRRAVTLQLAKAMKSQGDLTISKIAKAYPAHSAALLRLRTELKGLIEAVRAKAHIASRVAVAILGHLNTAVRLLAGAVGKAGIYTKQGVPKVSARIGIMEAVG
jgi:hypothetical protein